MALDSEPSPTRAPTRTCVGCRARVAKSELLRVTVTGATLRPDPQARQPGRGSYIHPTAECVGKAVRRQAFARALRLKQAPDAGPLVAWIADNESASRGDVAQVPSDEGATWNERAVSPLL